MALCLCGFIYLIFPASPLTFHSQCPTTIILSLSLWNMVFKRQYCSLSVISVNRYINISSNISLHSHLTYWEETRLKCGLQTRTAEHCSPGTLLMAAITGLSNWQDMRRGPFWNQRTNLITNFAHLLSLVSLWWSFQIITGADTWFVCLRPALWCGAREPTEALEPQSFAVHTFTELRLISRLADFINMTFYCRPPLLLWFFL